MIEEIKVRPAVYDPERCHAFVIVQHAPGFSHGKIRKYITWENRKLVSKPIAEPCKSIRLARFTEQEAELVASLCRDESSLETDVMHCHRLHPDPYYYADRWEFLNVDVLRKAPHDQTHACVTDAYGQKWMVGPGMAEPLV